MYEARKVFFRKTTPKPSHKLPNVSAHLPLPIFPLVATILVTLQDFHWCWVGVVPNFQPQTSNDLGELLPGDSKWPFGDGEFTWPFQGVVGDLQLGDEKVTLNHLVYIIQF